MSGNPTLTDLEMEVIAWALANVRFTSPAESRAATRAKEKMHKQLDRPSRRGR